MVTLLGKLTKDTINVTVCNVNLCSNKNSCKSYTLYPPPPCEEDPFQTFDTTTNNAPVSNKIQTNRVLNKIHEKDYFDVDTFLNPANDRLYIESEVRLSGVVSIFDVQGNKLYEDEFKNSRTEAVDMTNLSLSGVYFVVVRTREYVHSEIITFQR